MANKYHIIYTDGLPEFFKNEGCSVLVSTYQAARVIAIGSTDGKELFQIPVSIKKPMGIAHQGEKLAVAGLEEIVFFSSKEDVANTIRVNERNFDNVYVQRASYNTSTLDIHDIHFGDGVLWGVNTLFSCLCTFDINYNFRPKWKPPFIDSLAPEDRCHLNGMAFDDKAGLPKYVTALSATNEKDSWRKTKMSGGVLMEVATGEILLDGLAMPHTPRLINDELFFLESGTGKLLKWNTSTKQAELIYDFGCFVRGMSHNNGFLYIGKSQIRPTSKDFKDLDVTQNSKHAGVIIFDLANKNVIGEINYEATVEEIFDVQVLADHKKPLLLGDKSEKYKRVITFPGNIFWRSDESDNVGTV